VKQSAENPLILDLAIAGKGGFLSMDPIVKRFNTTPLEYLSQEQMRDIHSAALEILEDCGTMIHHDVRLDGHQSRTRCRLPGILDHYRPQPLQAEVDAVIDKILGRIKGDGSM
jgi:hypothetical protein